jgi:hypothetical protein
MADGQVPATMSAGMVGFQRLPPYWTHSARHGIKSSDELGDRVHTWTMTQFPRTRQLRY